MIINRHHRFDISFEGIERVVVERRVRRHPGCRIHRMWIGYLFSEVILGGHSRCGKHRPWGTHLPTSVTNIMAGTTAADRDFLTFYNFWIVPARIWRETPKRLAKTGQLQRDDCVWASWFFDIAINRFRRAKRFVNDAVGSEHVSTFRLRPVVGRFAVKLQEKNRSMPSNVITIVILFVFVETGRCDHIK